MHVQPKHFSLACRLKFRRALLFPLILSLQLVIADSGTAQDKGLLDRTAALEAKVTDLQALVTKTTDELKTLKDQNQSNQAFIAELKNRLATVLETGSGQAAIGREPNGFVELRGGTPYIDFSHNSNFPPDYDARIILEKIGLHIYGNVITIG